MRGTFVQNVHNFAIWNQIYFVGIKDLMDFDKIFILGIILGREQTTGAPDLDRKFVCPPFHLSIFCLMPISEFNERLPLVLPRP
jgi:hypothetical protein